MTDLVDDLDLASIKDSATPTKACYKVWGAGISKRSNRQPEHVRLVYVSQVLIRLVKVSLVLIRLIKVN